jgi:hypothetical protein
MKKLLILATSVAVIFLNSCTSGEAPATEPTAAETAETATYHGDSITAEGAITTAELVAKMQADSTFTGKVETVINSCCKKKGCWMRVALADGKEMKVTFKDYGFFVPLESAGKPVVMEGKAYYETLTVEELKHYAEDAGKTEAEIDAITMPEPVLAFEATGIIIKE